MDADVEMEQSTAACGWGVRYRSVVGVGTARVLFTAEEKKQGLGAIMEHYAVGEFSFPEARLAETMVVRIDIESITGKQSGY
jgi:nitroimidazol reductase NimA-like FMN-containing flavoprotein (pyridoxamine 5'-phosphate oxidase superfamily)